MTPDTPAAIGADALIANLWKAIGRYSAQIAVTGELAPCQALCDAVERVRAALASAAQAAAVPPGYVLVPVEPTLEMLAAKDENGFPILTDDEYYFDSLASAHRFGASLYRAMLAAAPKAAPAQLEPHPPHRQCGCIDCAPSFEAGEPTRNVEAEALEYIFGKYTDWQRLVDERLTPPWPLPHHFDSMGLRAATGVPSDDDIAECLPLGIAEYSTLVGKDAILSFARRVLALVPAPQPPAVAPDLHPKTADLVRRFADALAEKLAAAEKKYGYSDGWASPDWMDECRAKLIEHLGKGDPRDVAAYCAFLWHHGESTAAAPQLPAQALEPVAWRLTNTAFRKPRFEYHDTKEQAERRQADFNRSVDDGSLRNLTPLYANPAPAAQGDAEDAARYRYLTRSMGKFCVAYSDEYDGGVLKAEAADAAIDAARAQAKEGGA